MTYSATDLSFCFFVGLVWGTYFGWVIWRKR